MRRILQVQEKLLSVGRLWEVHQQTDEDGSIRIMKTLHDTDSPYGGIILHGMFNVFKDLDIDGLVRLTGYEEKPSPRLYSEFVDGVTLGDWKKSHKDAKEYLGVALELLGRLADILDRCEDDCYQIVNLSLSQVIVDGKGALHVLNSPSNMMMPHGRIDVLNLTWLAMELLLDFPDKSGIIMRPFENQDFNSLNDNGFNKLKDYQQEVMRTGLSGGYSTCTDLVKALKEKLGGCAVAGEDYQLDLGEGVVMSLKWIEGGRGVVGSPSDEPGRDGKLDKPQKEIKIKDGFWIGVFPVTQSEFRRVMGSCASSYPGGRHPADDISWNYANDFCAQLNGNPKLRGRIPEEYEFSLPTEEQWEYAGRAGTKTALNSGESPSAAEMNAALGKLGWFRGNWNEDGQRQRLHDVGLKAPNSWGLHDIHGNIAEWCRDLIRVGGGAYHVLRGGCYRSNAEECRLASRELVPDQGGSSQRKNSGLPSGLRLAIVKKN